tara:strand:- start:2472 stop:2843 length:372 start_codon:yes stop_codon:yes gene_type:complete
MFYKNKKNNYMKYIPTPIIDVHIPTPVVELEKKVEKVVEKSFERMLSPEPEDRLEKDAKIVKRDEPKDEEEKLLDNLESLKTKFLNVKNKSLFIKKNKEKIKNLSADHQREFINLAKEYFGNN